MNFCVLLLVYKDRIWRLHVSKFDKKVIPRWKMSQLISLSSFFPAADTLLSIWGVWGANQILLSLFYLAVVTRYRGLLPFAILLFTLEFWSGILVGDLLGKKVTSKRTPPGNMDNFTYRRTSFVLDVIASVIRYSTNDILPTKSVQINDSSVLQSKS